MRCCSLYGAKDAYAATIKNAGDGMPSSMFAGDFKDTFKLDPGHGLLAPLAGVGRDAVRRGPRRQGLPQEHLPDGGGLLSAVAIVIVFLILVTKTMGWTFFEASANGYMGVLYGYIDRGSTAGSDYLSPTAMVGLVVDDSRLPSSSIAAVADRVRW